MTVVRLPFRSRPEVGPAGNVTILGSSLCSAEVMRRYAQRRNPHAPDLASLYLDVAAEYGVRGDVAYCQAMLDTRTWTSPPGHPPWRPIACSIWGDGVNNWTPDRLEKRVELHIQYLHAFASAESPYDTDPLPGSRMKGLLDAGLCGSAKCWENLNGKWVLPGTRYGQDIVAIWRNMREWNDKRGHAELEKKTASERDEDSRETREREHLDAPAQTSEDLQWLLSRGLLPTSPPYPDRRVTWRELAQVLRAWESGDQG